MYAYVYVYYKHIKLHIPSAESGSLPSARSSSGPPFHLRPGHQRGHRHLGHLRRCRHPADVRRCFFVGFLAEDTPKKGSEKNWNTHVHVSYFGFDAHLRLFQGGWPIFCREASLKIMGRVQPELAFSIGFLTKKTHTHT